MWLAASLTAAWAAPPPALTVEDAWIRAVPGAQVAAAYMTLRNDGATPIVVIGVRSSIARMAMIHETREEHGQSTMRAHERLVIPAHSSVQLSPGGLHVMLHILAHPLAVGEPVSLVLELEGGASVPCSARVRPLSAE